MFIKSALIRDFEVTNGYVIFALWNLVWLSSLLFLLFFSSCVLFYSFIFFSSCMYVGLDCTLSFHSVLLLLGSVYLDWMGEECCLLLLVSLVCYRCVYAGRALFSSFLVLLYCFLLCMLVGKWIVWATDV